MIKFDFHFILALFVSLHFCFDTCAQTDIKTKIKYGAHTSAIGQIKAKIISPVSVSSDNDLRFGMIVTNNHGDVTIDESGNRTTTGPGLATSGYSAGSIRLKGPRAQAISVDIPEVYIYNNEDKALSIHSFTTNYDNSKLITLDPMTGDANIDVGASLNISDSKNGAHTGIYRVQTSY